MHSERNQDNRYISNSTVLPCKIATLTHKRGDNYNPVLYSIITCRKMMKWMSRRRTLSRSNICSDDCRRFLSLACLLANRCPESTIIVVTISSAANLYKSIQFKTRQCSPRWKTDPLKCSIFPERPIPFSPVHL